MSEPAASPVTLSRSGRILTVEIDFPPVNALALPVRVGLLAALRGAREDREVDAIILQARGRTFVAGGDISEFDAPAMLAPTYNDVFAAMDQFDRPIVAALHGSVLGGGLELAMAAHYRVALAGTRLGQPEVRLGIVPGAGGTQRLPRLAGIAAAIEMMTSGAPIPAERALALGIVDEVVADHLREAALALAGRAVRAFKAGIPLPVVGRRELDVRGLAPGYFDDVRARLAPADHGGTAAREVVRCVETTVRCSFEQGLAIEQEAFEALRLSPSSKALRHVFFAEREAAKVPGLPGGTATRPIRKVGIVGAGTMGIGIAMTFADAGFPVVLMAFSDEALQRGLRRIRAAYAAGVAKGRLSAAQLGERLALLAGTTVDGELAGCDLLIEAVFDHLAFKRRVCARLGAVARPGAIIATNTSSLDVDMLARATGRPADVVGMRYFSPANVMRLLEVVRAAETAPDVLATVLKLAAATGKAAVVSGARHGFIGNRMAEVYTREAEFLLMEGASPARIDGAVEAWGMAMGPCRMLDLAGVDVGARIVIEAARNGALGRDPRYRAVVRKLYELGRLGQKTGAGYYRYEGRTALPDPETARVARALGRQHGIVQRDDIADDEIVERLLYPMINEGYRILEEGVACRPGDIDIVWTAGFGFPAWRGGPMHAAHDIGLGRVSERLARYGRRLGHAHGYWEVAPLLAREARG